MAPCNRAAYHTGLFTFVEAFLEASCRLQSYSRSGEGGQSATPVKAKGDEQKRPGFGRVPVVQMSGVPTGIRTPVATVKG